jgi:hypothetical protein
MAGTASGEEGGYYGWNEAHIVLDGKFFPAYVWRWPPQMSYTPMCEYASFEYKIFLGYFACWSLISGWNLKEIAFANTKPFQQGQES